MTGHTIILDGGMGRELLRMGAPFRQPEWSALALMEAPEFVTKAHGAFIAAGAEVIITNSYSLVPFHIGEERFATDGRRLADLAGRLARESADAAEAKILVAGSLPPPFGTYRPDLFDAGRAPALLEPLVDGLSPHVDLWLGETLSSLAEAEAVKKALIGETRPLWIAFTLADENVDLSDPRLRSGESVADAVSAVVRMEAAALLFNCSQPEVMGPAIETARRTLAELGAAIKIGVYANAFPPKGDDEKANEDLDELRADLDPPGYLAFAKDWVDQGAEIVGGCCGIGPEHIAALRAAFPSAAP